MLTAAEVDEPLSVWGWSVELNGRLAVIRLLFCLYLCSVVFIMCVHCAYIM